MTRDEFAALLNRFAARPVPATSVRHVYLWHDDPARLRALIPVGLAVELDLYALAAELPRTPYASDEARRLLLRAIRSWLHDHTPVAGAQQAVVVTGTSLLMRYQVPLHDFYQVTGETRMVILVVSPAETTFQPPRPLPPYVQLRPRATLEYLQAAVGAAATVGALSP